MREAPVLEENGLCTEGEGPGTALLVDIHNCCHVVRQQLNVPGSNEGQEHPTGKAGSPQFQNVDVHPHLSRNPVALCHMALQMSVSPSKGGIRGKSGVSSGRNEQSADQDFGRVGAPCVGSQDGGTGWEAGPVCSKGPIAACRLTGARVVGSGDAGRHAAPEGKALVDSAYAVCGVAA